MCPNKIVIEGITENGAKFRPSDWAERITGNLFTVKNHRMFYSPLIRTKISKRGNKCIVLDHDLQQSNPELYQHILSFAKTNNLRICDDED